jgi:tRNA threonylcarbamoyladenosine biosynthesis protein TsaB
MYTLILDSATKILYVALVNDDKILYQKYVSGKNDHAKSIVFCVDEALATAGITAEKLDKIVVGIGPGSYTGVRMAVTVAKMLSTFKNIPLYSVSTLFLMASGTKGRVLASIDARRGNSFSTIIDTTNDKVVLEEALHENTTFDNYEYDYHVNENEYSVDPLYVIHLSKHVDEPHLIVPNYLRDTEAERNLK